MFRPQSVGGKDDKECIKGSDKRSQDLHDSRCVREKKFHRREGRSDSIVESSKPACDGKESIALDDHNNVNSNQNHKGFYGRDFSSRSNSNSNSNSPQPIQRNRNCTITSDIYGNDHQTSGYISSGLNPQHACTTSLYHPPHAHTTDDFQNDYMSDEVQFLWIQFMDGVALLQAADVSHLNPASDEALCMYLNLYHLMVIHSCLVIGPPCSAYKVFTYPLHWTSPYRGHEYSRHSAPTKFFHHIRDLIHDSRKLLSVSNDQ